MKQITEDYVSFETAKLLKEKGFLQPNITQYYVDIDGDELHYGIVSYGAGKRHISSAPTLQMAMKWLREVHKIHIIIEPLVMGNYAVYLYYNSHNECLGTDITYEKAADAAIKYCLTYLI